MTDSAEGSIADNLDSVSLLVELDVPNAQASVVLGIQLLNIGQSCTQALSDNILVVQELVP
ncbi:MAG: hypothetical protein DDT34_02108 [Firmicutes bacterium]|nr:hypothetical protein [Bacillota bacterium]